MEIIDLSVFVENSDSEPMKVKLNRLDFFRGARKFCRTIAWNPHFPLRIRMKKFFDYILGKRKIVASDFPGNAFISLDIVTLPTHMGTHLDAPFHFGPSTSHECKTVDKLPLDWFYRPGVRLDMRHKKSSESIEIQDIISALKEINYEIKPLDIVLIWTGNDKHWGTKQYFKNAPGMSRDATLWLIDQGVKVIGIDTYSFDRPFDSMLNDFWRTGDSKYLWPAHFLGREKEYVHIERLANLDKLPAHGFYVSCFPIKLKGADASWIRCVGVVEN